MRAHKQSPLQARTMIAAGMATLTGALAVVLLSGVASGALFGATPKAADTLALSARDQQIAWNDLSSMPSQNGPVTFRPSTTSAVPSTVDIHAIKGQVASDVPTLKPYDFAKVQNKLLIINPHDMMIAAVITG